MPSRRAPASRPRSRRAGTIVGVDEPADPAARGRRQRHGDRHDQDLGPGQVADPADESRPDPGRSPAGPEGDLAEPERRGEEEEGEAVAQRIAADRGGDRQEDVEERREQRRPLAEEGRREAEEGDERREGGEHRDELRGDPPGGRGLRPMTRATGGSASGDEGRVERMLVGAADDVDPGLVPELAGDPDEFQAVLGRQAGSADHAQHVEDAASEARDREQSAAGHRAGSSLSRSRGPPRTARAGSSIGRRAA